jgi:hypothetical protein
MCQRFAFLIMRVVSWLRLSKREDTWKTAEILILRHQLAVLQRRQPRPVQLPLPELRITHPPVCHQLIITPPAAGKGRPNWREPSRDRRERRPPVPKSGSQARPPHRESMTERSVYTAPSSRAA